MRRLWACYYRPGKMLLLASVRYALPCPVYDWAVHFFLLQNLLFSCKYLITNYYLSCKIAKGTNWKQKFQKPQNENICLTNLNVANNGNFPILAFGDSMEMLRRDKSN